MSNRNKGPVLARYAGFVARHPRRILIGGIVALALSLFAARGIVFTTDIAEMLPADNAAGESYLNITEAFATTSSLLVVVRGEDRASVRMAAEDLADRFRRSAELAPYIRSVRIKLDPEFLKDWGLLLMAPDDIRDQTRVLERTSLLPLVRATNDILETALGGEDADTAVADREEEEALVGLMTRIELFALELRERLESSADQRAGMEALAEDFLLGDLYLTDPEGTTLVFSVTPSFDLSERRALTKLTAGARSLAGETEVAFPRVSIGFTGDVASEADEERALGLDAFLPSILAYAGVFILFSLSFSRRRSVPFALLSLGAGIILDLGITGLVIGELNMITSSFGSILVGLGIDFGIHIVSRFDAALGRGVAAPRAAEEAICATFRPVALGALTTAAAFFALLFSRTAAFRQFAVVAGTGILTTLGAMYSLLPALLVRFPGKPRRAPPRLDYTFTARIAGFSAAHPRTILVVTAIALALSLFGIPHSRFNYDMRSIGPLGTEAQRTEAEILERLDLSSYTVLASAKSLAELRALETSLLDVPNLRRVESLADYLPALEDQEERLGIIEEFRRSGSDPTPTVWDAAAVEALAIEVERLEDNLIEFTDLAAASLGEGCLAVRKRNAMIREIFGAEIGRPGAEVLSRLAERVRAPGSAAALAAIDRQFAPALASLASHLAAVPGPLAVEDLPEDLRRDYRSVDGASYLLIAYPDRSVSGEDELLAFDESLGRVSPSLTGSLQLGIELSRLARAEAIRGAGLVGGTVLLLLLIGFRSLRPSLLALANLAVGLILTLGLYPLLGAYNVVNILALPLIIGIGIDYGIHLVHESRRGSSPQNAMRGIGRALMLSSMTTMIGFGSLGLVGSFRGISSLGTLLFVGSAACLVSALVVLPALISLWPLASPRADGSDATYIPSPGGIEHELQ